MSKPTTETGPEDFADVVAKMHSAREARVSSVPCRLVEASDCKDGDDWTCPLRKAEDCPERRRVVDEGRASKRTARAAEAFRASAWDTGIPREILELLGLIPPEAGRVPLPFDHDADSIVRLRDATARILVLSGPTGCGKSVAAGWWCWEHRGLYRRAGAVMRSSWFGPSSEVDRLIVAPALVLDDLMAEQSDSRGVWRSHLDELIDSRFADGRPTLLTSNMPPEDLPQQEGRPATIGLRTVVGERVWDRIRQDSRIEVIVGASMRGRQAGLPGVEDGR